MPTFNILLAQDITNYGIIEVEADTWEAAVATLTLGSWDECCQEGDGWEQRVVHVESEDGQILSEDLNYNAPLVHSFDVACRLRRLLKDAELFKDFADLEDRVERFAEELQAESRHPIFNKEGN